MRGASGLAASAFLALASTVAAEEPLGELPATFVGTLPCADCPGIDWQLDLLPDGSFQLRRIYQEREPDNVFDDIGRFAVSSDGRSLALQGGDEAPTFLEILATDRLRLMDMEARPIVSDLPYDLVRVSLLEPRLVVSGMYSYMADAGRFTECLTGRSFPVAMTGDNIALERAYLEARTEPAEEIRVDLEARIALLPPMEGEGLIPTIEPLRFLGLSEDGACPPLFGQPPLEGTEWHLTRLGETVVASSDSPNAAHLVFMAEEGRFAGAGGCNRMMGGYSIEAERIEFSAVASTMMACVAGMDTEAGLISALEAARSWRVLGTMLDLFDADGEPVARFTASSPG